MRIFNQESQPRSTPAPNEPDGKPDKASGGGEHDEIGRHGEGDGAWDGGAVARLRGLCEVRQGHCVGVCVCFKT